MMEERRCTAEAPMPIEQKDDYFWIHAEAQAREPFFNLMLYECPHCGLWFPARHRLH